MDRAQQLAMTPAGLDVRATSTNGNHDGLVQGNEDAERRLRGHRDRLLQGERLERCRTTRGLPDPDGLTRTRC